MSFVFNQLSINDKCSLEVFVEIIFNTSADKLPQCYVCIEKEVFVGYLLMVADTSEKRIAPFTWNSISDTQNQSEDSKIQLATFEVSECDKFKANHLKRIAQDYLETLLTKSHKREGD